MSLTALPPELFSCVVANIESQPTLCNLARCSRQLHFCTVTHLYRYVTIQEVSRHGELQNEQIQNIASLLIRRPDLARLVRHFTLHAILPPRMRAESSKESEDSESPEELQASEESKEHVNKVDQVFKTAVNASSSSKEEETDCLRKLSHTHTYHHDLVLSLILPALVKVEKLVLDLKTGFHNSYL